LGLLIYKSPGFQSKFYLLSIDHMYCNRCNRLFATFIGDHNNSVSMLPDYDLTARYDIEISFIRISQLTKVLARNKAQISLFLMNYLAASHEVSESWLYRFYRSKLRGIKPKRD